MLRVWRLQEQYRSQPYGYEKPPRRSVPLQESPKSGAAGAVQWHWAATRLAAHGRRNHGVSGSGWAGCINAKLLKVTRSLRRLFPGRGGATLTLSRTDDIGDEGVLY